MIPTGPAIPSFPRKIARNLPSARSCRMFPPWPRRRIGSTPRTHGRTRSIFQAMDAAGKDSTIKHVMSGVNPQGCQVYSFKHPSAEDLDHNFLCRDTRVLPSAAGSASSTAHITRKCWSCGFIPSWSKPNEFPKVKIDRDFWTDRYEDINALELRPCPTARWSPFFLHVSKDEQRKRFLKRLEDPKKHWKFAAGDLTERGFWEDEHERLRRRHDPHQHQVGPLVHHPRPTTSGSPAASSWCILVSAIEKLDLRYPEVTPEQQAAIEVAKKQLAEEG